MVLEENAPEVQPGMPGTHCYLEPSSFLDTWWVFKNRNDSEAGTCTSQFSSYYWQRLPLGTGLREAGVESYGEVCTFCQSSSWYPIFNLLWATNLFSLPILLQLPLDFLSRVVFILCFTHPLLLPSVSPHLPSHHADCRPNQPWTSLGTLQN